MIRLGLERGNREEADFITKNARIFDFALSVSSGDSAIKFIPRDRSNSVSSAQLLPKATTKRDGFSKNLLVQIWTERYITTMLFDYIS